MFSCQKHCNFEITTKIIQKELHIKYLAQLSLGLRSFRVTHIFDNLIENIRKWSFLFIWEVQDSQFVILIAFFTIFLDLVAFSVVNFSFSFRLYREQFFQPYSNQVFSIFIYTSLEFISFYNRKNGKFFLLFIAQGFSYHVINCQ